MPIQSETGNSYIALLEICKKYDATLLAVSKTRTEKEILALYKQGQKVFGENRAHELVVKAALLPTDIEWHLIGHLQTNKVKAILPFVHCIQSLDSVRLWQHIHKEAKETGSHVRCLLQIKIASEETKYGWEFDELESFLDSGKHQHLDHVIVEGVMGMATLTENTDQVRNEFRKLKDHFNHFKDKYFSADEKFNVISMGMSGDFEIALAEGSNMIRIGSLLFEH